MNDHRLDAAIKAELPPLQAPDTLRALVQDAIRREAGPRRLPASWLAAAATLFLALGSAWTFWTLHLKTLEHAEVTREVARAYEGVMARPETRALRIHGHDATVGRYKSVAVFTWAEDGETGAPRAATVGTHHLLYWKHGGVEWWVVGDNAEDVTRFAGELKAHSG
jgi:hypothetical protein